MARESYIVSDRVVIRACCTHDSSTCFNPVLVLGLVGIIKIFDVHHLIEPNDIVVHILSWGPVFVVRALIERYAASTSWNKQQSVRFDSPTLKITKLIAVTILTTINQIMLEDIVRTTLNANRCTKWHKGRSQLVDAA